MPLQQPPMNSSTKSNPPVNFQDRNRLAMKPFEFNVSVDVHELDLRQQASVLLQQVHRLIAQRTIHSSKESHGVKYRPFHVVGQETVCWSLLNAGAVGTVRLTKEHPPPTKNPTQIARCRERDRYQNAGIASKPIPLRSMNTSTATMAPDHRKVVPIR